MKLGVRIAAAAFAAAALSPVAAHAGDPSGNFQIKAGYTGIFWDDENHGIKLNNGAAIPNLSAHARDSSLPTATLTYFLTKNIGVELFCCFATAKVIGDGLLSHNTLATTWAFPPALTLKYNFDGMGPVVPYIGVGAQWIHYFSESSKVPGFNKVSFDDSFGLVLQGGFDYNIGNGFSFGLDVKKVWEDTKITFSDTAGNRLHTRHDLDPLLVTANIGYRFDLFGRGSAAPLK